jgi:hypothetical protein
MGFKFSFVIGSAICNGVWCVYCALITCVLSMFVKLCVITVDTCMHEYVSLVTIDYYNTTI